MDLLEIIKKEKAVFITGTDTGIGKTFFSKKLLELLRRRNIRCGYMKPFASGDRSDARVIKKALGLDDTLGVINPCFFKYPLAPYASSQLEKKPVKIFIPKIRKSLENLKKKYGLLIVEGIGGVYVPLKKDYLVFDFIRDMGLPAVIVSASGLGAINHTLLTLDCLKKRGVRVCAIVLNKFTGKDLAQKTNLGIIKKLSGLPVFVMKKERE